LGNATQSVKMIVH